ncbi:MAG: hypothetical protein K2K57_03720 [Oscillospiraceae bacterium]|nr:hypothetical protein [Oscillospiraceae bacterium]
MGAADVIAVIVIIALLVCAVRYWVLRKKGCGCGSCNGCGVDCEKNGENCKRQ